MSKLRLTRDQLAAFLQDFRSIKQFEQLFDATNYSLDELESLFSQTLAAQATANEALTQLTRIAEALELLSTAPTPDVPEQEEVFLPALQASVVGESFYPTAPSLVVNDLADADIGSPASRQTLVYYSGLWHNAFLKIDDLEDVYVSSPANGHILIYDAAEARFENAAITPGSNIEITNGAGAVTIGVSADPAFTTVTSKFIETTNRLHYSSVNMLDGAANNPGTLTNCPLSGDPTKWISVDDNGTQRWVPAW